MAKLPRPSRTWIDAPAVIVAVVVLLLLAGIGVIMQSEAAYRDLQEQETRVQAEILAASVTAALDSRGGRRQMLGAELPVAVDHHPRLPAS